MIYVERSETWIYRNVHYSRNVIFCSIIYPIIGHDGHVATKLASFSPRFPKCFYGIAIPATPSGPTHWRTPSLRPLRKPRRGQLWSNSYQLLWEARKPINYKQLNIGWEMVKERPHLFNSEFHGLVSMLQEPAASCDGNSHCSEVVDHVSSYQQQQAQFLGDCHSWVESWNLDLSFILNTEIICKWLIMIIFQSYDRLLCLLNPKVNHQRYERTNGGLHWIYHMRYGKISI